MFNRASCLFALLLFAAVPAWAGNWPAFRGGDANTVAEGTGYPTEWGSEKNIAWRTELPGDANSSPILFGRRVFVTTAQDNGKNRTLHCFHRETGKELWAKSVEFEGDEPTHKTNPYAASSPVTDGERVIVWHGTPGVFCYDMQGNLQWQRELGEIDHIWGYGSSPILYKDRVILNHGPGTETFLVALDKESGEVIWKTEEPGGSTSAKGRYIGSWSTPVMAEVDGETQILCSMPTRVVAYDPEDGNILWTVGGLASERSDLAYTSLIVSGDIGVAMGGFKGPALAFKLGGQGDVTEKNRLWRTEGPQPQRIGTGVIVGDHIYMANAGPGTIQCLDLKTGKQLWVERVKGNHWGSMVLADGHLYVTNKNGTTYVLRPDPESCQIVATNELDEPSNATPAFSDGELFLRTSQALYCISKQAE